MAIEVEENPDYTDGAKPRVAKFRRAMPPTFESVDKEARYRKSRLAMACRIVAAQGWGIGCGMQLSSRDPQNPSTIWVVPAGRALAAVASADLLQVDIATGDVVYEHGENCGYDVNSVAMHRAIYAARPDVGAVIHGHTPHARAFAMQDMPLKMIVQDSCTFYQRVHRLPFAAHSQAAHAPDVVASTLGQGKGLILENRGILLVGATIECPISYYIRMESLCQIQLAAEAAAKGRGHELVLVGEQEVQFTFDNSGSEHHAWLMAMPYFSRMATKYGAAI